MSAVNVTVTGDTDVQSIIVTLLPNSNGINDRFKVEYIGDDALINANIVLDVIPAGYQAESRTYNFTVPITVGLPTYETLVRYKDQLYTDYIIDSPDIVAVEDMVGNVLPVLD